MNEETKNQNSVIQSVYKETTTEKIKLTDWLYSIILNKNNIMDKENEKKYPQFIINNILSKDRELIFYIDAINNLNISNRMHYDFLLNAIVRKKRFLQFPKKKIQENEIITFIKRYYNVSYDRALKYYKFLDDNDINNLKKYFNEGGLKKITKKG